MKAAEVETQRSDLADKIRERVIDVLRRDFQVAQEISEREVLRQRLIEVDYRFGQRDTTQILGNLNALDRQKAETFKTWARLRSQMARIKLLVLGAGEE